MVTTHTSQVLPSGSRRCLVRIRSTSAHVTAVAFDTPSGRLDLRPDSSAYAVQTRLSSAYLVAAANQATGREVARTIRALPPGSVTPVHSAATGHSHRGRQT